MMPLGDHLTSYTTLGGLSLYKYQSSLIAVRNNDIAGWATLIFNNDIFPSNCTIKFNITMKSFAFENIVIKHAASGIVFMRSNVEPNEQVEVTMELGQFSSTSYNSRIVLFSTGAQSAHMDCYLIDNLRILSSEGQITTPILNVTWDKSSNLIESIPQLPNLNLIGDYIVSLVRLFMNENGELEAENIYTNALSPTNAVAGQETYSHSIDMAGEEITPNSQIQVNVVARSFSNYNGIDVFTGLGGLQDEQFITFPIAPSAVNIIYGNIDEEEQLTVVNIVILIDFVLGLETPTEQEIQDNDYNNDGILNIKDILALVNIILDADEN